MITCYYIEFDPSSKQIHFEQYLRNQKLAFYDATASEPLTIDGCTLEEIEAEYEGK